jgi:hypothetical protein
MLAWGGAMEIEVKVGTEEQRQLIRSELLLLGSAAAGAGLTDRISRVSVPVDFEGEVRRLTGDSEFTQNRGYHLVLAKVVKEPGGMAILISPLAFAEGFDTQIRVHFYVHELTHVEQEVRLAVRAGEVMSAEQLYRTNLRVMSGEYEAERHALETCARLFEIPSQLYTNLHRSVVSAHFAALADSEAHQALLKASAHFKLRITDIDRFQVDVRPIFDWISKSLAYSAAYVDSGTGFCDDTTAYMTGRFVTDQARQLVSYFARKYNDGICDLADGIDLMRAFVKTLGFVYEDTDAGLYCRVVGPSL